VPPGSLRGGVLIVRLSLMCAGHAVELATNDYAFGIVAPPPPPPPPPQGCEVETGVDWKPNLPGQKTVSAKDSSQCCAACARDAGCKVGVLFRQTCYLKVAAAAVTKIKHPGATSCQLSNTSWLAMMPPAPAPPPVTGPLHAFLRTANTTLDLSVSVLLDDDAVTSPAAQPRVVLRVTAANSSTTTGKRGSSCALFVQPTLRAGGAEAEEAVSVADNGNTAVDGSSMGYVSFDKGFVTLLPGQTVTISSTTIGLEHAHEACVEAWNAPRVCKRLPQPWPRLHTDDDGAAAPGPPPPDCGEQPHWIMNGLPGDQLGWTQAPPLPWGRSLLELPVSASLVLFFTGNNSGPNSDALNQQLARFGHVGIGWQLTGSEPSSHVGHIEVVERTLAAQLRALSSRIHVFALRNDQVVSPLWDCARARMMDPASVHMFLRNASGALLGQGSLWQGTKTQPLLSGSVHQYWLNFSEPSAREWWADVFVGGALREPNISGVYFDCACNSVTPDAVRTQRNAALRPTLRHVFSTAARSNKLLLAYKPNGPTTACDRQQVSRGFCAEPMRYFISLGRNTSTSSTMIMLHGYGGREFPKDHAQSINASVAAFLIARSRGGNSLLRLSSCVGCPYNWPTPPWSPVFDIVVGAPLTDGTEDQLQAGVFRREFAYATVELNCTSFVASFHMKH
jgi:hypothetical protein